MPNSNTFASTPTASEPLMPPPPGTPLDSDEWQQFFYRIYDQFLQDGSAVNKLWIQGRGVKAAFSGSKLATDDLVTLDAGLLSEYLSDSGNPIYGFAANVRRSAGIQPAIGGQFAAYGNMNVKTASVIGVIGSAISEVGSDVPLTAGQVSLNVKENASRQKKIGLAVAFGHTAGSFGSNRYNVFSRGIAFTADGRTALGEYAGWNIGIDFGKAALDQDNPPAYDNAATYNVGEIVASGGVLYKCIKQTVGHVPPNVTYWLPRSIAGTYGANNYAVGIDFTGQDSAGLAVIWSAIRFQAQMVMHWEETGVIGSWYDDITQRHVLSATYGGAAYTRWLEVNSLTGELKLGRALIAPGGGGAATIGNTGGSGPTTAAQNSWLRFLDAAGNPFFIPVWK